MLKEQSSYSILLILSVTKQYYFTLKNNIFWFLAQYCNGNGLYLGVTQVTTRCSTLKLNRGVKFHRLILAHRVKAEGALIAVSRVNQQPQADTTVLFC